MTPVARHVAVVGGGIAGLAAAVYLARGGRTVTVFEKNRHLGGRAVTHLRHGFRFNLGPHAVYRFGPGSRVLRELGIPIRGGIPKRGGTVLVGGRQHRLPVSPLSILQSSLLPMKGKLEAVRLLCRLPGMNTRPFELMSVREWADRFIRNVTLRDFFLSLCRVVTYSTDERQCASVALDQLKRAMLGVVYVHEGWQKIVDSLHSTAVAAGVNFVTSSRVIGVETDGRVRGLELGGLEMMRSDTLEVALPPPEPEGDGPAARVAADTVLLAIDPTSAANLVSNEKVSRCWRNLVPVTLACLDVALSRLPNPKQTFAVSVDRPYYYSVHSAWAQLTPRGGALIHVAKYRAKPSKMTSRDYEGDTIRLDDEAKLDQAELEAFLEELQPGWRDLVVHRRFLPSLAVTNALTIPSAYRPQPQTSVRGLYLAGDWVGGDGVMADAALTSARAAARAILAEA
jgi:phytoene dehydrogenase-like protein